MQNEDICWIHSHLEYSVCVIRNIAGLQNSENLKINYINVYINLVSNRRIVMFTYNYYDMINSLMWLTLMIWTCEWVHWLPNAFYDVKGNHSWFKWIVSKVIPEIMWTWRFQRQNLILYGGFMEWNFLLEKSYETQVLDWGILFLGVIVINIIMTNIHWVEKLRIIPRRYRFVKWWNLGI